MHTEKIKLPLVSFCMSTYKRPGFLKKQLHAILQQTFSDFEVIVSDNDPDCSAMEVVSTFNDPRIHYFSNVENLGMIKSFNKSIARSKGEYIVMITDDDPIYPEMLQTLVDMKNTHPGFGMYLGGCDLFCTHVEVAKTYGLKIGTNSCLSNKHNLNQVQFFEPAEFVENLFTFKIFPHYLWSTGMVERNVLIERGGVPDYGTPFLGDYAYLSIMGSHSGCAIINTSLGCQTIHDQNFGRNQNEQLPVVAKAFPPFIAEKLSYLPEWPELTKTVHRFVGIWTTGHMAFLHHYRHKNKDENSSSFATAEKDVFKNQFMKKYKVKYLLKKYFPAIHDSIVKLKQRL